MLALAKAQTAKLKKAIKKYNALTRNYHFKDLPSNLLLVHWMTGPFKLITLSYFEAVLILCI